MNKSLKEADAAGKILYVSPKLMKTSFFKGLQKLGLVEKVGKRFQVKAPVTGEGTKISFREPIQARSEAKKHGVEFRGMQPAAKDKVLFNWHDPKTGGDFYTATIAELPAKLKQKRADFAKFDDKNLSFRTTVSDVGPRVHPAVDRALKFIDNTFKFGPAQQFARRLTDPVSKVMLEKFKLANREAKPIAGKLHLELADILDPVYKLHGFDGVETKAFDRKATRAQREKLGQDLHAWVTGFDVNNKPVKVPANMQRHVDAIHKLTRKVWDEVIAPRLEPGMRTKIEKNYLPRVGVRDLAQIIEADIAELLGHHKSKKNQISDRLLDGTPDRKVMAEIERKNKQLAGIVEHVLKNATGVKTVRQAMDRIREQTRMDKAMTPNFLKKRTLDLPASYFERDIRNILGNYITSVAKWGSEVDQFGKGMKELNKLQIELERSDPKESELMSKFIGDWFGIYDGNRSLTTRQQNWANWFTQWQVATKIGAGGATILNLAQPFISIFPKLGFYVPLSATLDVITNRDLRRKILRSGAIDPTINMAHEALLGVDSPGTGKISSALQTFANRATTLSGFQSVNKGLLYMAAASMEAALPRWHKMAQGTGLRAQQARAQLKDFGIDYRKKITEKQELAAMAEFALNSQLQKNMLREPLITNDKRFKPLFLFKRFGIKQANYMFEMIRTDVIERRNPGPLIRLAVGGYLGGASVTWGLNQLKSLMQGEPVYRQDDSQLQSVMQNLAAISAFGVVSDILANEKITDISGSVKFALTPVAVQDPLTVWDNWFRFFEDWERYGDGWLAARKNTYRMFDIAGTFPRAIAKQALTPGQKESRLRFKKTQELTKIRQLIFGGDITAAQNRQSAWNDRHPNRDDKITDGDYSHRQVMAMLERRARSFAAAEAEKGTPEFERAKRKKLAEFRKQFRATQQESR